MTQVLAAAIRHHRAGRLKEAEAAYRRILASQPMNADVLRLYGLLAHQAGDTETAIKALRQSITLKPSNAEAHFNLGNVLRVAGRLDAAEEAYRRAVEIDRDLVDGHNNLGNLARDRGDRAAARACFEAALARKPDLATASNNLGMLLLEEGERDRAETLIRAAIASDPDFLLARKNLHHLLAGRDDREAVVARHREGLANDADDARTWNALGTVLASLGRFDEAEEAFTRAVALVPDDLDHGFNLGTALRGQRLHDDAAACFRDLIEREPEFALAHLYLGNSLDDLGDREGAMACYRRAIARRPGLADAHFNLGAVLQAQGRFDAAEPHLRRALEIEPRSPHANYNLAVVLRRRGHLGAAAGHYRAALAADPGHAAAVAALGTVIRAWGKSEEAEPYFRRALEIDPEMWTAHANILLNLQALPDRAAADVFAEHRAWAARYAAPLAPESARHDNDRDPERRLRIGYVSPDFHDHSVAFFIEPPLEAHDREHVEIFCYADDDVADAVTERLRGHADHWRSLVDVDDAGLAEMVRADRIDILVDLTGHTAKSRLLAFARRPAPVQVSYLGYPDTTGMDQIDYRLTDALADPDGVTDPFHSECLVRLPQGFLCYRPPDDAPPVGRLPALAAGRFTFGSFNNLSKITSRTIAVWADVLKAVDGARLIVKSRGLVDEAVRRDLLAAFARRGVDAERIDLYGAIADRRAHLDLYNSIDIALDSFPYNGATTTCEALWMGVPVITLAGERHAGRVGNSILGRVGLADLVAADARAYVTLATELAGDRERLADLRRGLRERVSSSPLADARGFTRALEEAYRTMWRDWVAAARDETRGDA